MKTVSSLKSCFDDEEWKNVLQDSFCATTNNQRKIFCENHGMQVYTTLIEKLGMPRLRTQEHAACNEMIDKYCDIYRIRKDNRNKAYLSNQKNLCGIKNLLEYGLSMKYYDENHARQSHLAYAFLHICGEMPVIYEEQQNHSNINDTKDTKIWQQTQWHLLKLLGSAKYHPDWSYEFCNTTNLPDFMDRGDFGRYPEEGSNLLTAPFSRTLFHPSLKPLVNWVIACSKRDGIELLNRLDGNKSNVFSALDRCKNYIATELADENRYQGWHRDENCIKSLQQRLIALNEIDADLQHRYNEYDGNITNPLILAYIIENKCIKNISVKIPQAGFLQTVTGYFCRVG